MSEATVHNIFYPAGRIDTCELCPFVEVVKIMNGKAAGCNKTGLVVPFKWTEKTNRIEYLRVPLSCPRDDSEVIKRPSQEETKELETK